MPVTVTAIIETIPPSHHAKTPDRETRELLSTADTYEQATTQIRDQVPPGWRIMHYRVPTQPPATI